MNEKTYPYRFYYLKAKYWEDLPQGTFPENPTLYAYSDTKKVWKAFERTRDMNRFFIEKRDLTREEVHYLTKNHESQYLINWTLATHKDKEMVMVDLVMTKEEKQFFDLHVNSLGANLLLKQNLLSPYIFTDHLLKYLNVFEYQNIFRYTTEGYAWHNVDFTHPFSLRVDELDVFISMYQSTMSVEKDNE